ncbi:MAG: hypothetical protein RL769_348, partial [Pseudomonadota bacterium]
QYGLKNPKNNNLLEKSHDQSKIDEFVAKNNLRYYNFDIHQASFALPNFVKNLINSKNS